jgi:hypothetical protein
MISPKSIVIKDADPLAMFAEIAEANFTPSSEKSFKNCSEARCAIVRSENDDFVSILLYLRGSSHVLIPTNVIKDIKIEWSCNGILDGAEINHIKNSWRMCKLRIPSLVSGNTHFPFHYYCNNTDFCGSDIPDENGIFVPIKGRTESAITEFLHHLTWEGSCMKHTCASYGISIPHSDKEWSILHF